METCASRPGDVGGTDIVPAAGADMLWRKVCAALCMMLGGAGVLFADYFIRLDVCFNLLVIGLTIWGLQEFYAMCKSRGTMPFSAFGTVAAVLLIVLHWLSMPGTIERLGLPGWTASVFGEDAVLFGMVVAIMGSLWLQATKKNNEKTFESIASTLFGILYCWFLASFLVKLRHMGADGRLGGQDWNKIGTMSLLSCLAVSKFADVGAYLTGRKLGRHRLIPRISPKKSWEGFFAGLAASIAVAYLLWGVGFFPLGAAWMPCVFGVIVGAMGMLGDLAESLLKRGSGVKDTGNVIPGFGGILDVVDSLLLSAPAAYFLVIIMLRLGGAT